MEVGLNYFVYGYDYILIVVFILRLLWWDKIFLYMFNNGNVVVIGIVWDKVICYCFYLCYFFI